MYKVLLVDDEPYVLEGLKLLVDWESRGFAVCGEASDGEDALEAIAQCRPDLVVTDIRMPAMSGLDLMRLARQQFADYEPQFIVLSGYGEFQYANAAMKYNAADYLLKPINAIEFDRALAKLSGVLAKQDAERNDSPLAGLAADRFSLGALIQGMQAPYQDRQTAQKLGISERTDVCVVLADANPNCSDALQQAIAQWEPIAAGVRLLAFDAGGSRFGAVVAGKPVRQAAFLSAMHRQLSGCMHEPLSLFASDWSKGFADLRKLYEQAAYMRDNYPFGSVSLTENVYTAPRRAMPEGASVVYPVCDYSSLYRLIDEGEAAAIPAAVDHIFAELHREGAAASVVRAAISDLSISLLRRYPPPTAAVKDHGHGPPGSADPVLGTGLRELRSILVRQCAAAAGMRSSKHSRPSPATEASRLLRERFREPIKLRNIAEELRVQPAYLGQLFKKEIGVSFHEFLHRERVEEARSLLRRTDMKIADVARSVGFTDADDFVRHFKSIAGMLPSAYRSQSKRGT